MISRYKPDKWVLAEMTKKYLKMTKIPQLAHFVHDQVVPLPSLSFIAEHVQSYRHYDGDLEYIAGGVSGSDIPRLAGIKPLWCALEPSLKEMTTTAKWVLTFREPIKESVRSTRLDQQKTLSFYGTLFQLPESQVVFGEALDHAYLAALRLLRDGDSCRQWGIRTDTYFDARHRNGDERHTLIIGPFKPELETLEVSHCADLANLHNLACSPIVLG